MFQAFLAGGADKTLGIGVHVSGIRDTDGIIASFPSAWKVNIPLNILLGN